MTQTDGVLRVTREELPAEIKKEKHPNWDKVPIEVFEEACKVNDPTTDVAAALPLLAQLKTARLWVSEQEGGYKAGVYYDCLLPEYFAEWSHACATLGEAVGVVCCLAFASARRGVRVELIEEGGENQ